jgi:hypothetical protein
VSVLEIKDGSMMLGGGCTRVICCILVAAGLGKEVILPDLVCVLEIMDYDVICIGSNLDLNGKKLEMLLNLFLLYVFPDIYCADRMLPKFEAPQNVSYIDNHKMCYLHLGFIFYPFFANVSLVVNQFSSICNYCASCPN